MHTEGDKLDSILEEIRSECIFKLMRHTDRVVSGVYSEEMNSVDVTPSQFYFLVMISIASKSTAVTPALIAREMGMDVSTVSRNIKRLQSKELVEGELSENGYLISVTVTNAGMEIIGDAYPAWKRAQEIVERKLGGEMVGHLRDSAQHLD